MAKETKRDGVIRATDENKEGVQVDCLYVYRVSESGEKEPGIEKDRNGKPRSHCGMTGVQGYLTNVRENTSRFKDAENKEFAMVEISLTRPAYGIREADSEEVTVPAKVIQPGSLLLVPVNHALSQLRRYAEHPTHTIEVMLIPGEKAKKPTAKGFYPRNWQVRVISKNAVERGTIEGLAALPALPETALPALPTS